MGKILVTGKRLNLGVRGHDQVVPGVAMHPGQESWSVSVGEAHIPQSLYMN